MNWFKIRYNKKSAKKYGWRPFWFNATGFDLMLVENIKAFQRAQGLETDGLCGPATYRRAFTEVERRIENSNPEVLIREDDSFIVCNGDNLKIEWDKVRIDFLKEGCYKKVTSARTPAMIVTHWDAALSANSCKAILEKRKISTHFCIDNDGTIVQLLDTNHIGWHAGIRAVNKVSIGVDFSNAVYEKYNKTYEKRGFGLRPIIKDWKVHGRTVKPFLGYYPVQLEAYKALVDTLCRHYDILLECPLNNDGSLNTGIDKDAAKGKFKGIVNHYNLTAKKWDTLGLELDKIIEEIKTN
tara:strand:- start:1802 stop:2692 length:891 start_codon:yes stop_codon:yes gene_type:complete